MTPAEVARIDAALATVLPPGALFAVGGRVRDEVRSALDGIPRPAKDLDYVAVGIGLESLLDRLRAAGRADVVGAAFSVVKVTVDGTTVDVALPRRERSTGVGHRDFAVEAGPAVTLEDDLARRDFRMNMMARRLPDGAIVDPYGGRADIEHRRIDLLRAEAFEEDPLRMLRGVQFAARFDYALTPATLAAMAEAAPLAGSLSAERVRDELEKLLTAATPSRGFEIMRETGLLTVVFPELAEGVGVEQNEWHAFDVFGHALATTDAATPADPLLRLAALLHDVGKPRTKEGSHFYRHEVVGAEMSAALLERLRYPSDTVATVSALVRWHMYSTDPEMTDATIRRFVARIGSANLSRQFALRHADIAGSGLPKRGDWNERFEARVAAQLSARPALSVADLPVSGLDATAAAVRAGLLPAGSRGGRIVGEALRSLLDQALDHPEQVSRTWGLAALARFMTGAAGGRVDADEPAGR